MVLPSSPQCFSVRSGRGSTCASRARNDDYLDEKRDALDKWASYLAGLSGDRGRR